MLGAAARRELEFAWKMEPRDRWRSSECPEKASVTVPESDPACAAALIRQSLVLEHLQEYGDEEMPWIAREAGILMELDPSLVEDIYIAVFQYEEDSEESTDMTASRILRLSGTRKQDYGMARFELARVFPGFVLRFPEHATRSVIAAVEAYVQRRKSVSEENPPKPFEFRGRTSHILIDYSSIWDSGPASRQEEAIQLLDALILRAEDLVKDGGNVTEFRKILQIVAERSRPAIIWRRLLVLGTKYPKSAGQEIAALAWSIPILTGPDTNQPCGEYLRACFAILPGNDRERIECAILAIPGQAGFERREYGEHIRNRLLGCLPAEWLVTNEAKSLLMNLQEEKAVPDDERLVRFGGVRQEQLRRGGIFEG